MRRRVLLLGVLVLGLCAAAHPQTLSLGVSAGGHFPRKGLYRDIYGAGLPVEGEVRLTLFRNFGLAAGLGYLRQAGEAVNVNAGPDNYTVRFRMVSFPVSGYILFPLDRLTLLGGAGLSFHSYEEEWQDAALGSEGSATKPFVYAGLEVGIGPRLGARLTVRYETITAGKSPFLADEIDLGGLTLLLGLSVRLF